MAGKKDMKIITNTTNPQIKEIAKLSQKKYRDELGLFLVEGQKCIEQAANSNYEIQQVFVLADKYDKYKFLENKLVCVNEAVIKKISTTQSPCEAVAIVQQKIFDVSSFVDYKRLLLLENIKDAGNLGTIVRTACAFNIDGIVLVGDCVDIYNPKVVRASVGNLFQIPVVTIDKENVKTIFQKHNLIATIVKNERTTPLDKINFEKPFVLMFGSEAQGLSADLVEGADIVTTINMNHKVESLNLSVATAIILHTSVK